MPVVLQGLLGLTLLGVINALFFLSLLLRAGAVSPLRGTTPHNTRPWRSEAAHIWRLLGAPAGPDVLTLARILASLSDLPLQRADALPKSAMLRAITRIHPKEVHEAWSRHQEQGVFGLWRHALSKASTRRPGE